jgi:hypothetical protein
MKNVKMQCVELYDDHENPVHCPLCGVKICASASDQTEWMVEQCEHLLFLATDEGFEYRSDRFDKAVEAALNNKSDEEREDLSDDVNALVELVEIQDAFMFQSVMGPPAQFNSYVAFAPIQHAA